MRKLISGLLAILIVILLPLSAYAAESPESPSSIGVFAKYVRKVAGESSASVQGGRAQVSTGAGTTVSVSGAPETAGRLVVYPFPKSEKEAWQWIEEQMAGKEKVIQPYDIYFLNKDGGRLDLGHVTVSIGSGRNMWVYGVSAAGQVTLLNSSFRDGKVWFTANGSSYYVLAERSGSGRPTAPDGTPDDTSPRTGDESHVMFWTLTMLSALLGLLLAQASPRKKRCRRT